MHRSATSLVASWLQACGLAIDDGRVLGSGTGNKKGHFEDKDFLDLHFKTIRAQLPRSGGWLVTNHRAILPDQKFDAGASELIAQRNGKYPFWGWKDPRTTVFLNQWKRLIPDLKVLLLWRPCADVVSSLHDRAKRDGDPFSAAEAVLCWRAYNRAALEHRRRWPSDTVLVSAPALIVKDREVMQLIQSRLCLDLRYTELKNLYDPDLLKQRPASTWTRILSVLYSTSALERQLHAASDVTS